MLENTNIWTKGPMHLWVNNKPAHVYVPANNVKDTYNNLKSRLSKEGSIPIGIDHLPDNIIEANPILKKLDLLNVGEIRDIAYANDTITIVEAELTNPLIQNLYEAGELDMVSIVANSTTSECPSIYDYKVDTTDITRVDIVEKGACKTCNIPKPTESDSDSVVYARYSIKPPMEDNIMAEEITMEAIEELLDKKLEPINERLDKLEADEKPADNNDDDVKAGESDKVKEMEAKIAELQKETATAKVDSLIAAGKILPAQKESSVELCASNPDQFEALYKDAPVLVDLNTRESLLAGDSDGDDGDGELSPEEENLQSVINHFNKGE